MQKVKLVGAERYVGPGTKGDVIEKGAIIELEGAELDNALSMTKMDESNNIHPLFKRVKEVESAEIEEEEYEEDDMLEAVGVKPKRVRKVAA